MADVVIAKEGNIVEWTHGDEGLILQGKVLSVRENTVLVDLTINPNWQEKGLEEKTVVAHRKYTIVEKNEKAAPDNKTIEVVPGSLENYHALRDAEYKDSAIRALWDKTDTEINWHTGRFYKWKRDHGLVKSYKKEEEGNSPAPVKNEPQTEIDMLQEKQPDHPLFTGEDLSVLVIEPSQELMDEIKNTPISVLSTPAIEVLPDTSLQDEMLQLRNELMQTRNELWTERTTRLFSMQAQLDALICESNGLQISDYESEHILATIVELAEVAQEEQSFKYWKKQKDVDRAALLEEVADVLHFIISRGVQRGFKRVAYTEVVVKGESITDQMLLLIELLLRFRQADAPLELYIELFNSFRILVEMLGFNWQELSDAYDRKHSENIARQNNNY